jgi:hypothetical protein
MSAVRVTLRQPTRDTIGPGSDGGADAAHPFLDSRGPRVVLGPRNGADGLPGALAPRSDTVFGPRGACLAAPDGPLFVCDTGHHRLLGFERAPQRDHQPADWLIGQGDFSREGRNGRTTPGAATLNVPTGVAACDGVLAVADAWNHRVLLWRGYPDAANRPADCVLGQADFESVAANRGGEAGPDTLNWCYGVSLDAGRLFVADTGNRRVLVWNSVPWRNGTPADLVLGQADLRCRDEGAGRAAGPGAVGMRWPHGIAVAGGALFVADAGNNRIMAWDELPGRSGTPCDRVLGQDTLDAVDHNKGRYWPDSGCFNMPYSVTAAANGSLIVADTANSRLLGWSRPLSSRHAQALAGQARFDAKGDNRWLAAARDSLCWPYGVAAMEGTLVVADSGNNRVLLWDLR